MQIIGYWIQPMVHARCIPAKKSAVGRSGTHADLRARLIQVIAWVIDEDILHTEG
jgi:hypothetical protein